MRFCLGSNGKNMLDWYKSKKREKIMQLMQVIAKEVNLDHKQYKAAQKPERIEA